MRILSWNVNGIRAVSEKGLWDWLKTCGGDVVCLQETKAHRSQLGEQFLAPEGYPFSYWAEAVKKGYSGLATYCRTEPRSVRFLGIPEFDDEGRVLITEWDHLTVVNAYFPNSQDLGARIDYKVAFCEALQAQLDPLAAGGRNIVVCGDFNVAHQPIDLARPKENEGNPGYLPEERAWMDRFTSAGWIDSWRALHPGEVGYSWWSYRAGARARNIGWRIDYHALSPALGSRLAAADIHPEVTGSDHCPVSVDLNF